MIIFVECQLVTEMKEGIDALIVWFLLKAGEVWFEFNLEFSRLGAIIKYRKIALDNWVST